MVIELFLEKADSPFAELTVKTEYVGKDPQAFLAKQAKNYAKIRNEAVRAEAAGLKPAIGRP